MSDATPRALQRDSVHPLRTLFDAAARRYCVKLTCLRCKHVRVLHGHGLWWMFEKRGWNDRFDDLRRRAICERCFKANGRKVRWPKLELVHEKLTGEPLPLPSEQEWKRALRRVR
jgi:hypothetical protein